MSKVYFNHTTKLDAVKNKLAPAATIAISRDGNLFRYGVAMCSYDANFNKEAGRKIAEARLHANFKSTVIPENLLVLEQKVGESVMVRLFLYQLSLSITSKSRKWKRAITKFNLENKRTAKIVVFEAQNKTENQPAQ